MENILPDLELIFDPLEPYSLAISVRFLRNLISKIITIYSAEECIHLYPAPIPSILFHFSFNLQSLYPFRITIFLSISIYLFSLIGTGSIQNKSEYKTFDIKKLISIFKGFLLYTANQLPLEMHTTEIFTRKKLVNETYLDCIRLLHRAKVLKYFINFFKNLNYFSMKNSKKYSKFSWTDRKLESRKISCTFLNSSLKSTSDF